MGTQHPLPKKEAEPPQFSAHVYCGQTAGWIKMALGMEVGLGPVHIVLDGDTAPLPSPQFSAHLYCGRTAGCIKCIKMPLGMDIGLSSGDFVLGGDPAPTPKGTEPDPIFGPRLLWPNGCMDQDTTWYGGRPRPTRHCVRCGCSYPKKKGHTHPTQFLAYVYCGQMAG